MFVTLRSITVDDAEFSYNLRRDPRFVDVMGQTAKSFEAQKEFIEWQREEPGDYYFVVYNRFGERIGLIGAYNIEGDACETGRELNIGAPYETLEAELLINRFCYEVLKLNRSRGIVYKRNAKHFGMLKRRGGYQITEIVHNGVPAYLLETAFEDLNKRMDKIRVMINKISIGEGML